jgi:hypothetical protein
MQRVILGCLELSNVGKYVRLAVSGGSHDAVAGMTEPFHISPVEKAERLKSETDAENGQQLSIGQCP